MASPEFVHLHVHTQFSLLDGACRMGALASLAKNHKMPALAVTDHGNLFGVVQFYSTLKGAGIKPILGYEAYVAPGSRTDRSGAGGIKDAAHHLTLLAETQEGYNNLRKLASIAYLEGFYYRPRIDEEVLDRHKEGLIVLSGCASGELCRKILNGRQEEAEQTAARYLDMLGRDHYFIELQDNGLRDQRVCMKGLLEIAKKLDLETVATNDIHYPKANDAAMHEVLLCINTGKTLADKDRMQLGTDQFYFKSPEEMAERFGKIPGAIENTVKIAERCNVKLDFDSRNFPRFAPPEGKSDSEYLEELCRDGLRRRYEGNPPEAARKRLEYELDVIEQMGYSSYFLIVWDLIRDAREHNVPNGLRGSGAGAMVCYVLEISDIDPLEHKLLFERFLDPQRREPPDLDIDLCERGREEVMDYVKAKYGEESTAQIITFGTMAARGAVRDVGRVLGWSVSEVDALAKRIPGGPGVKLREAIDQDAELARDYKNDQRIHELLDYALKLEGLARHASTHAAGIVIADKPLTEFIPVCKLNDVVMSQFAMGDLEKSGMLKLDLLGLRTLTIVNATLDLIEERTGKRPDMDTIPLDDSNTYDLLCRGDTKSVFQLGSTGMQELLRRLKPRSIADIVAVVAMYRPGPLQSGMVDDFIERRHGRRNISYVHPGLEPVLKDTYGVIVYQEQIMRILHELGGLSLADALTTIKAISKKKAAQIEKRSAEFLAGAEANGIPKRTAKELFDLIRNFAQYGFNRAHATAYAFLAYRTAWLKANYPMEFTAAGLTCEMTHSDKLKEHIRDCRQHMDLRILPPCINEGEGHFTVCGEDAIRFGMVGVRNVGSRAVEAIVEARDEGGPFKSLYDFCERVEQGTVNRQAIESLIKAGALDCLPGHRAQKVAALEEAMKMGRQLQADHRKGQAALFDTEDMVADNEEGAELPAVPEWSPADMSRFEKEVLGLRLSFNPLERFEGLLEQLTTATAATLDHKDAGEVVVTGGEVVNVRPLIARNGKSMAHLELEDLHGAIRGVVFSDAWQEYGPLLKEDAIVFVVGQVDWNNDQPSIKVQKVLAVDEARNALTGAVKLHLKRDGLSPELLENLRAVCERHPGRCPVVLEIAMPDETQVTIRAGRAVAVRPTDAFGDEVNRIVGREGMRLMVKVPSIENHNGRRRFNGFKSARN